MKTGDRVAFTMEFMLDSGNEGLRWYVGTVSEITPTSAAVEWDKTGNITCEPITNLEKI